MAQRRRINLNHKLYPVLISSIQTKWTFFWFSIAEKQKCGKSIIFSKKKLKKTVWSHFSTSHIWLHTYTSHTWFVWWKSATMSTSFLSLKKQTKEREAYNILSLRILLSKTQVKLDSRISFFFFSSLHYCKECLCIYIRFQNQNAFRGGEFQFLRKYFSCSSL